MVRTVHTAGLISPSDKHMILSEFCAVFGDGSRDARDSKELAIQQKFFDLQSPSTNVFMLKLNVTQGTFDGRGTTYASGVAYMKVFINEAPVNGTCSIQVKKTLEASTGKTVWAAAQTGRALMDEFLISCQNWVDPNGNSITKYIFKSESAIDLEIFKGLLNLKVLRSSSIHFNY